MYGMLQSSLRQETETTLGISSRKGFYTESEDFTKSLEELKEVEGSGQENCRIRGALPVTAAAQPTPDLVM